MLSSRGASTGRWIASTVPVDSLSRRGGKLLAHSSSSSSSSSGPVLLRLSVRAVSSLAGASRRQVLSQWCCIVADGAPHDVAVIAADAFNVYELCRG